MVLSRLSNLRLLRLSLLVLGMVLAAPGTGQIRENDPRMDDVVGALRITDLGTAEMLQMLEQFTGQSVLRQQNLPAVRINFNSQGPLTRRKAILAIESLLALNGIAITEVGDQFLKAVPAASIAQQVPPLIEGSAQDLSPSQKIYSKFFRLDYLFPEEAATLIQPLMSQGAPQPYIKSNSIFLTDALVNLQRIENVLGEVDRPREVATEVVFIPLEHTAATDILRRLQQLTQTSLRAYLEGNTFFDADERTNQLIVISHPSNLALIEDIVERLDIDVAPLTTTEIYYIKHAEAPDVVSLIEQVISGQQAAREEQGQGRGAPQQGQPRAQQPQQQAQPQQPGAMAGGGERSLQFSDFLTIVADERSNAVVASGTVDDQKFLSELIDKIDILLAQVRIEVVIAEVTLGDSWSRGIDAFQGTFSWVSPESGEGPNFSFNSGSQNALQFPSLPETSGIPFSLDVNWSEGSAPTIDLIIGTGRELDDVRILQAPTIVTTHNKEASISVGESRPVVTSSVTDLDTVGSDTLRTNVQFRDVGLELKVKPLIGANGVIQLEVTQSIETVTGFVETTTGQADQQQPIIGSREATSFLGVRDGQLVVLGGLQSVEESETERRVFLLGELPLVGPLFRSTTNLETRRELLIFIKPTVLQGTKEAWLDAQRSVDAHTSQAELERFIATGEFPSESFELEDDEDEN